jgi:hypothetical protein
MRGMLDDCAWTASYELRLRAAICNIMQMLQGARTDGLPSVLLKMQSNRGANRA